MRRKLLQATVSALLVAVVLLGIPLGVAATQFIFSSAQQDLKMRATTAVSAVETRYDLGDVVDERTLTAFVPGGRGAPRYIELLLPDGTTLTAGTKPDPALTASALASGSSGATATLYVAWWDVFLEAAQLVGLVFAVAIVAVIAGVAMASWQAERLSRPLVYLAASAEQVGSGQTRPRLERTGVEEIDLVAEELSRSADRMAARLAAERQFASDASHQLRTPLTALTMRLEEISLMTDRDEVREEAEASLEQVERLVGVVDDLLGRSRRALGASTELLSLHEVFDQQREEWTASFSSAGRELVVEETDSSVFATPGGLAQVLATLIENSLHHGGGKTTVSARESGSSHAIVIEVKDEGDGVPDELAPRIFEREVTSGRGHGLGLALARDLVTADGGRLELSQRRPAAFSVFLQGVPRMVDLEKVVPHGRTVKQRTRWVWGRG